MSKTSYITIQEIVDNLMASPLMEGLPYDRAINDAIRCIKRLKTLDLILDKAARINIKNYRGILPKDIMSIVQIRAVDTDNEGNETYCDILVSTDSFITKYDKTDFSDTDRTGGNYYIETAYKIQGDVIYTTFEEGTIDIIYKGLCLGSDGLPLIPDIEPVVAAIEYFIKMKWYSDLADIGRISDSAYQKASQMYSWNAGQAQTWGRIDSLDEREAISNVLGKLYIDKDRSQEFYREVSVKQRFRNRI